MTSRSGDRDLLRWRLKLLIADLFRVDILEPAEISDDEQLLGADIGLDSLDLVELAIYVEEEYGITIHIGEEWSRAFANIASLADFIHPRLPAQAVRRALVQPESEW